jgi:hypothetical protein
MQLKQPILLFYKSTVYVKKKYKYLIPKKIDSQTKRKYGQS